MEKSIQEANYWLRQLIVGTLMTISCMLFVFFMSILQG